MKNINPVSHKPLKSFLIFAVFFLSSMVLLIYGYSVEPYWLRVRKIVFPVDQTELDGIKIMHISDLQLKGGLQKNEMKIIELANRIKPEIIVLTGDFIEVPYAIDPMMEFIDKLPKVKIYGVLGNWDHWTNISVDEWKKAFAAHNAILLMNECVSVKLNLASLTLAGVDDPSTQHARLIEASSKCSDNGLRVLLSHAPIIFEEPEIENFDLVLAGHCHGGQIVAFGKPLWLPPGCGKYLYGIYRRGKTIMYISSGVGTSILPIRLFARPEVVVIELRKKQSTYPDLYKN